MNSDGVNTEKGMRTWAIHTRWPGHDEATFIVVESGVVIDIRPANSALAGRFSSIEGFDVPGASPLPTVDRAAVTVGEAVRGEVDVTGCSVVAYPARGNDHLVHSAGRVLSVIPAAVRR